MTIKTIVLNQYKDLDNYIVTYRYWVEGDCACGAKKIKRTFKAAPTEKELENAI